MSFFLVIDQGTTSTRAIIFNTAGQPIASAQQEITQYYPCDGWIEHDPEEIWVSTLATCHQALKNGQIKTSEIKGLGIANQRETTLIWHKHTGVPIHSAIVWQDRRTTDYCAQLKAQAYESMIQQKTGLLLDPYFSATKLAWLLDNIPNARQQAEDGELLFGTIETFLLWRLTDGASHYTDMTNASRTLLFNLYTQQWDDELLALFDIPRPMLPKIVNNHGEFGFTKKGLFEERIPIYAMAGDQQAAAFGQACFQKGMIKSTYGTGCFMLLHTGNTIVHSQHKLLSTIQYRLANETAYGLEGSIFIAGAAVQWLRDELQILSTSQEIQALAEQVQDNGGVYFIPAFTGLGAPYWNPQARGLITGLTRDSNKAHLARATLESVCYQTRDLIEAIKKDGVNIACLRVDGGMSANNTFLQLLADLVNIEVQRPAVIETTALGIAYLIGLQTGCYKSLADITQLWHINNIFKPHLPAHEREKLYQNWSYWVQCLNNR